MSLTNKTKFALLVVSLIFIYGVFVFLVVRSNFGNSLLDKSKFSKITPGKTSERNLVQTYGKPVSSEKTAGNTNSLFYDSSKLYQYNYVWTKNGNVIAVKEVLPDGTTKEQAIVGLGSPDKTYYDSDLHDDVWLVFLEKGVAVKILGDTAYAFIRFSPQTNDLFLQNIAPLAGIVTTKIQDSGEPQQ